MPYQPMFGPTGEYPTRQIISPIETQAYADIQQQELGQQYGVEQQQTYQQFINPYMTQLMDLMGTSPAFTSMPTYQSDPNDPALMAMTSSIEQRGGEAQRALASEMARRGIFSSGPSLAASALQTGETEALIGQTTGEFALAGQESALQQWQTEQETALSEWQSRLNAILSTLSSAGSGFPT